MSTLKYLCLLISVANASATQTKFLNVRQNEPSTTASGPEVTAVSECHMHATAQYCIAGTEEYQMLVTATRTEELPSQYTSCHNHGTETFCISPSGDDVQLLAESGEESDSHDSEDEETSEESSSGENCHFHAGVEHCVGGSGEVSCERTDRDYNVPLRIGLLFVVLVTSGIGVFGPIVIASFPRLVKSSVILLVVKQFGTGVMISTGFVHLLTHAQLMFSNECLETKIEYESTTSAIVMAGLFVSFLIEYLMNRFIARRLNKREPVASHHEHGKTATHTAIEDDQSAVEHTSDLVRVYLLEAGIIFHSLLIGLTLVVAGDSFFLTLFAVIIFHQMFEGIALGSVIAALPRRTAGLWSRICMGLIFTLITPLGMAIGIGVLSVFNGNDPSTLIAIGTLDAVSAGILIWVGVVEMWAHDWLHGSLADASPLLTAIAGVSLVAGMALMSFLGKWT